MNKEYSIGRKKERFHISIIKTEKWVPMMGYRVRFKGFEDIPFFLDWRKEGIKGKWYLTEGATGSLIFVNGYADKNFLLSEALRVLQGNEGTKKSIRNRVQDSIEIHGFSPSFGRLK